MSTKRTHIVIPDELAIQIDRVVGKRGRSQFLTRAAWNELRRLRILSALERAAGSWEDKNHPELKLGAARWVEKLRGADERRLKKLTKR